MNTFEWQSYEKTFLNPEQCGFERVFTFLQRVDDDFSTKLSLRVNLQEYAEKLASKAFNLFVSSDGCDIAHVAFYCNVESSKIFITSIAVISEYSVKGIGKKVLNEIESFACSAKIKTIELEADCQSKKLLDFYYSAGYALFSQHDKCTLKKQLK